MVPVQLDEGQPVAGQPLGRPLQLLQTESPVRPRDVQPPLETAGVLPLRLEVLLLDFATPNVDVLLIRHAGLLSDSSFQCTKYGMCEI
jgi:hypothetical protein